MVNESLSKSIFIIIPSYEDPSLIATIQGAIDLAANPDRISFGIGLQHKRVNIDMSIYKNMEILEYDVDNRPGLMQIRNDLAALIGDRDYLLSIDAHMTFVQDWDKNIIADHQAIQKIAGTNKVVISCQMPPFTPPVASEPCRCSYEGELAMHNVIERRDVPPSSSFEMFDHYYSNKKLTPHHDFVRVAYTSMDLFFCPKEYVKENLFFIKDLKSYNDEPLQSYLLFMRGWQAYRSYKNVYAYHNSNPYKFESLEQKLFASTSDSLENMHECRRLFLYNTGKYSINSQYKPEDFYRFANIYDNYLAVVEGGKYPDIQYMV